LVLIDSGDSLYKADRLVVVVLDVAILPEEEGKRSTTMILPTETNDSIKLLMLDGQ